MECCKASQFSNDAGARIWQAADVGYLALQYGAWLTWACLTLQLSSHLVPLLLQESSHLVPLLLQESSLHFLSFFVKTFLVYFINMFPVMVVPRQKRWMFVTHTNMYGNLSIELLLDSTFQLAVIEFYYFS